MERRTSREQRCVQLVGGSTMSASREGEHICSVDLARFHDIIPAQDTDECPYISSLWNQNANLKVQQSWILLVHIIHKFNITAFLPWFFVIIVPEAIQETFPSSITFSFALDPASCADWCAKGRHTSSFRWQVVCTLSYRVWMTTFGHLQISWMLPW